MGHFLPSIGLGKYHSKSHELSNPSVEGYRLAETQSSAEIILIGEQRNVSAYPDKCSL